MNHDESRYTRREAVARLAVAPVVLAGFGSGIKSAEAAAREISAAGGSPDAIVIGAGAIGCNTAWHLNQRGLKTLVVEAQAEPASQSTFGAAGFVAAWSIIHIGNWKKTEWEMQRYGIDFYTRLAKRNPNVDMGFSPCGVTYIYTTPKRWEGIQKSIEAARELGTKLEVLTAERTKELAPFLEFDQVAGIIFDPDAIRVRAGDAIRALAAELAKSGVEFRYNTKVAEIVREGDRVTGVRTAGGDVRCDKVIVTAGAWSRPLLAKLNVTCEATPFNETRYVTKPLAGLPHGMPLLIFADKHHYIREEQGGLLIGGGDDHPLPPDRKIDANDPPWCNKLPHDQAKRVREHIRDVAPVMPVLKDAEIESVRSGLPTSTKDRLFIAGPVPGVNGLFVMTGCQEAGITHGPALGRILTEYAVDGKTTWDASRYRVERFTS